MDNYIVYTVKSTTSRSELVSAGGGEEFAVLRRYNDFDWLRTVLEREYPSHLLPVRVFLVSSVVAWPGKESRLGGPLPLTLTCVICPQSCARPIRVAPCPAYHHPSSVHALLPPLLPLHAANGAQEPLEAPGQV